MEFLTKVDREVDQHSDNKENSDAVSEVSSNNGDYEVKEDSMDEDFDNVIVVTIDVSTVDETKDLGNEKFVTDDTDAKIEDNHNKAKKAIEDVHQLSNPNLKEAFDETETSNCKVPYAQKMCAEETSI